MGMLRYLCLIFFLLTGGQAYALDKVTFGTNWVAQPEHGGFYQALADGTYERYGLDVKIVPGGPRTNSRLMLAVGKLDFFMGGNMLEDLSAAQNKIPTLAVAAIFQKDPQMLMVHPDQGAERFEDLKNFTLMMSKTLEASIFRWIQTTYGFKAEKLRPYDSNLAPFCADKRVAQQGYVTSEPFTVEKTCGFKPKVFLFADSGYDSYSTLIDTRQEIADKNPDLVQRFVDASIIGWYNYLYGGNSKANELIKKDNPEMDDARIANSIAKMKEYGIVDSGDAKKLGIGAMTDARQKSFFDKMVKVGFFPADLDYKKAYTLRFVNKGVGLKQPGN
jgi:NitT/TauT family transport system substrate-binding protein